MIIDCISDLHGHYPNLEGGDLLIIAGDLTARDTIYEHADFLGWLNIQPYKKKIFIAGNHDNNIDDRFDWDDSISYLCDSGTEIEYEETNFPKGIGREIKHHKLKVWGSPWTLSFKGMNPKCKAFTVDTEEELEEKFALIPEDVDILITHSPPFTILDLTEDERQVGSTALLAHHLKRLKPKLWVFGHIHEGYGQSGPYQWNNTKYVNASHVNERYQPVNKPIRIIL